MSSDYKCMPKWVAAKDGNVPPKSVKGGEEVDGEAVYVTRMNYQNEMIPGKLILKYKKSYACHNGKEIESTSYETLTNPSDLELIWEKASGGKVPLGAVQGGYSDKGEVTYVARAEHNGISVPGKVHPSHGVAYVPWGGKEHNYKDYEVLVARHLHF